MALITITVPSPKYWPDTFTSISEFDRLAATDHRVKELSDKIHQRYFDQLLPPAPPPMQKPRFYTLLDFSFYIVVGIIVKLTMEFCYSMGWTSPTFHAVVANVFHFESFTPSKYVQCLFHYRSAIKSIIFRRQ